MEKFFVEMHVRTRRPLDQFSQQAYTENSSLAESAEGE